MGTCRKSKARMWRLIVSLVVAVSVSAEDENPIVTCGSVIKLRHEKTKKRLHSHEVSYGSGSGQQSVTGYEFLDDTNSLWVVKGTSNKPCVRGEPIQDGD